MARRSGCTTHPCSPRVLLSGLVVSSRIRFRVRAGGEARWGLQLCSRVRAYRVEKSTRFQALALRENAGTHVHVVREVVDGRNAYAYTRVRVCGIGDFWAEIGCNWAL